MKQSESGKARLIKGSLRYLWEEVKTLNHKKIRALGSILMGYLKMRYKDHRKAINDNYPQYP